MLLTGSQRETIGTFVPLLFHPPDETKLPVARVVVCDTILLLDISTDMPALQNRSNCTFRYVFRRLATIPTAKPGINCLQEEKELMEFDIDKLSREELLELNHRIVERLKYLASREALELSKKFKVGEIVEFRGGKNMVRGVIIRINRKTMSIKTNEGQWNVHPQFLKKVEKVEKNRHLKIIK